MRTFLVSAALALGLAVFAMPVSTVQAAPAAPAGVQSPATGAEPAQMRRRKAVKRRMTRSRAMRGRAMRSRMMSRRASPSKAGNARDPNRPVGAQSQGNTSGGPAR